MSDTIIDYKHHTDGHLKLSLLGSDVQLDCRWPLDMDTNEWFTLSDTFGRDEYISQIDQLNAGGIAHLTGRGSMLTVTRRNIDKVEIDMTSGQGSNKLRLILLMDVRPSQFLYGLPS